VETQRPMWRRSYPTLAASCLLAFGCATTGALDVMIGEAPKGAVFLERIPDRSFEAAHPIKLEQELIARVLRGVIVRDEKTAFQSVFSTKIGPLRAFSEADIAFLAPLISKALAQAAPDQQVGFRVINIAPASYSQKEGAALGSSEPPLSLHPQETTAGYLLAHGRSLHFTLAQYRHRPERADTIGLANRRLADLSGLNQREVVFLPEAARRPDTYKKSTIFGSLPEATFAIDYELLAKLPESEIPRLPTALQPEAPMAEPVRATGQPDAHDRELQQIKEDINRKNSEIEALRKEMDSIRREMGPRGAETETPHSRSKPAPKTQDPAP